MARIARVVFPGYPHHVTQRGSRRQPTFFLEEDYLTYLEIGDSILISKRIKWGHTNCVSPFENDKNNVAA